ncbi:MAG: pyridoxamine 5'-phosphate oxidase family protein, partial [Psychrobacillus psychrotolerans]
MTNTPETLDALKSIIKSAKVAMFVTHSRENRLVARPMQLQEVEFDGVLWFLT